jgi:hypothetical protein
LLFPIYNNNLQNSYNAKKNFSKILGNLTKKYFKGHFEKDLNILDSLQNSLEGMDLSVAQKRDLQKMQKIFFLGQLVGLPTLHSILTKFGIPSNGLALRYKQLCKALSINKIRNIFEFIFENQVSEALQKRGEKDPSIWSKELVTLVLDDSIFRQWLKSQNPAQDFEGFYACFFSGQYQAAVYGFKVLTLALSIEGVLYPLYFEFVKKAPKDAPSDEPKPEKAVEVAEKLVERWGLFKAKLSTKGIALPKLHLSCDNGYSDPNLAKTCAKNDLNYISVPKKNHYFEIDGQKVKLADWIAQTYLEAEKAHQVQEKDLPDAQKTAFVLRVRATYCAQNQAVTLLAFRLNGSGKVSIIYSTAKNIFAKTLRRHWFQRTYIEQFFKMLKHVLQISEARVRTKADFEGKLVSLLFWLCKPNF